MSFSIQLTGVPDFTIQGGRLVLSFKADTIRDRIFTALSTQLGEWFLNTDDGVPYFGDESNSILGGKMTEAEVGAILRRAILLVAGVDHIESMQIIQGVNRRVTVDAVVVVNLDDGTQETLNVQV